mmetsp:Transcript_25583/g.39629  ORF Transcript_25583/g.39629 Transcript_25583/m.39629 type:complete len:314 (+) Transcript_25583:80-1021(+)
MSRVLRYFHNRKNHHQQEESVGAVGDVDNEVRPCTNNSNCSDNYTNEHAVSGTMYNGENEEIVTSYYPSDIAVAWNEVNSSSEEYFQHGSVKKVTLLEHTLDSFYNKFFSDDAEFSLAAFHEQIGDTIKETSRWKLAQKGFHRCRFIALDHPVPGFGKAKTTKYQHCRIFDTLGLVVDSHIVSKGLPTLDCFYVEERILVTAVEGGGLTLSVMYQCVWIKPTWMKGIAERSVSLSFCEFFRVFMETVLRVSASSIEMIHNNVHGPVIRQMASSSAQGTAECDTFETVQNSIDSPSNAWRKSAIDAHLMLLYFD